MFVSVTPTFNKAYPMKKKTGPGTTTNPVLVALTRLALEWLTLGINLFYAAAVLQASNKTKKWGRGWGEFYEEK